MGQLVRLNAGTYITCEMALYASTSAWGNANARNPALCDHNIAACYASCWASDWFERKAFVSRNTGGPICLVRIVLVRLENCEIGPSLDGFGWVDY